MHLLYNVHNSFVFVTARLTVTLQNLGEVAYQPWLYAVVKENYNSLNMPESIVTSPMKFKVSVLFLKTHHLESQLRE